MQSSTKSDISGKRNFYRTIQRAILIIALIFAISPVLHASPPVKVLLKPPPPGHLGVGDLWNLELDNTTDKPIKIYLTGTVTEEKDGLIIEGKSKPFTVKPGKTSYKYNDFPGAELKYSNGKYKEIILRTGNAPEGSYTICVTAFTESGEIAGQENCIEQMVRQQGSINLISPEDGKELDPDTLPGLMFAWTALQGGGDYDLVIVEIRGEQSPDIAVKENHAFFEKKGMNTTSYQYSLTDPKFEKGKKYAWQVKSGELKSEVSTLTYPSIVVGPYTTTLTLQPVACTGSCFNIIVNTTGGTGNPINGFRIVAGSNQILSATMNSNSHFMPITPLPTFPASSISSACYCAVGYPNGITNVGTICLANLPSPYNVTIQWSTDHGATFNTSAPDVAVVNCGGTVCTTTLCSCTGNLIPNGNFTSGLVAGNMFAAAGGTGSISGWTCMKSTWARSGMGSCDNGYVTVYGSSVIQSYLMRAGMSFTSGTAYSIRFNAKLNAATSPNAQMRVLVGNGSGVPSNLIGTTSTISSTSWTTFTLTNWTPGSSFTKIAFSPINSSASVRSYVDIDNICITAVSNCNCPSPTGTWGNMTVTQTLPITLTPTPYNICNYGSVNNLSAGIPITFAPVYNCNPTTCAATYQWFLYNNTWPWTQVASGTGTPPFNITLPTNGQFHATFRPLCGGTLCPYDSAWVDLTTTCFCNWGTSITAKIGTGTPFTAAITSFRQAPLAPHTGNVGVPITITPSFDCGAPGCTATYELEVHRGAMNILVQNFTPVTVPITFTPTVSDWYRMVIRPKCGTQVCDTVDATIMINP